MLILRLILLEIVLVLVVIETGYTLKCRTEDGPSNGELKRVARSCMRKFGDLAFNQNSQQQPQTPYQHHQQPIQGRYRQIIMSRENREDSEESDNSDFYDDQYYNNNNNNNDNRNYNRQQYGHNSNNNERNDRGGNNGGGHNDERQHNNNRYNTNNRTVSNGNNNNNWNYLNQRNSLANNRGSGNNRNKNNNNNYNSNNSNQNNSFPDAACIVHCFFAEMHMLNHDDYPDRHKISHSLTKDIRDRELRNFYTDTIQECFRYLENQLRRNKCQFSRDLITCMTEYAKGNCDDWNEFNMIFN